MGDCHLIRDNGSGRGLGWRRWTILRRGLRRLRRRENFQGECLLFAGGTVADADFQRKIFRGDAEARDHRVGLHGLAGGDGDFVRLDGEVAERGFEIEDFDHERCGAVVGERDVELRGGVLFFADIGAAAIGVSSSARTSGAASAGGRAAFAATFAFASAGFSVGWGVGRLHGFSVGTELRVFAGAFHATEADVDCEGVGKKLSRGLHVGDEDAFAAGWDFIGRWGGVRSERECGE